MPIGKKLNNKSGDKIKPTQSFEKEQNTKSIQDADFSAAEKGSTLEDIALETVGSEGIKLENSVLDFSGKKKVHKAKKNQVAHKKIQNCTISQVQQHIIDGTFERVVDQVAKPKFIKESYENADAQGKADIKVMAAVAIASHGEEIADSLRKNKNIEEIKNIPEHHIADVMKMSMQFGASSKSMNAFMNILHDAGKLPKVIEHIFKDVKSSDLINITSSVMRLGLDPTPLTCAQTAFRLMSYALDHSGVQKNQQPVLFKFVSTMARGFQLGSNVLEAAGNVAGAGMVSGVSSFLIHRVIDYSMRQSVDVKVKYDNEDVKFSDAIVKLEEESKKSQQEREEISKKREGEREAKRQEVKEALKKKSSQSFNSNFGEK